MPMNDIVVFSILILVQLVGLVGVFIPILPGIPFMFTVIFIYSILDRFVHLNTVEILILLGLALLSVAIDYASGLIGARAAGASSKAISGGLIGMILGLLLFPPLGAIVGLFLGVYIMEIWPGKRSPKLAVRAATGTLVGTIAGMGINTLIGIIFLVLFSIFFFR